MMHDDDIAPAPPSRPKVDPEDVLRPDRCYSVGAVQRLIGVSAVLILEAIGSGAIAQSLACGIRAHVLGIDVIDWCNSRPNVWPGVALSPGNDRRRHEHTGG